MKELTKLDETGTLALSEKNRVLLQTCDKQMAALVTPKEAPNGFPRSIVVGFVANEEFEILSIPVIGGVAIVCLGAMTGFSDPSFFRVASMYTLVATAGIMVAEMFMGFRSGRTLGYYAQRLWRKIGLPARKLQALEAEHALLTLTRIAEVDKYSKDVAKIMKKAKPALNYFNANSEEYTFTMDAQGLKSEPRDKSLKNPDLVILIQESKKIQNMKEIRV